MVDMEFVRISERRTVRPGSIVRVTGVRGRGLWRVIRIAKNEHAVVLDVMNLRTRKVHYIHPDQVTAIKRGQ